MKQRQIQNVVIHRETDQSFCALADQVSAFHVEIIARRLYQSGLTVQQKIEIINRILAHLQR